MYKEKDKPSEEQPQVQIEKHVQNEIPEKKRDLEK